MISLQLKRIQRNWIAKVRYLLKRFKLEQSRIIFTQDLNSYFEFIYHKFYTKSRKNIIRNFAQLGWWEQSYLNTIFRHLIYCKRARKVYLCDILPLKVNKEFLPLELQLRTTIYLSFSFYLSKAYCTPVICNIFGKYRNLISSKEDGCEFNIVSSWHNLKKASPRSRDTFFKKWKNSECKSNLNMNNTKYSLSWWKSVCFKEQLELVDTIINKINWDGSHEKYLVYWLLRDIYLKIKLPLNWIQLLVYTFLKSFGIVHLSIPKNIRETYERNDSYEVIYASEYFGLVNRIKNLSIGSNSMLTYYGKKQLLFSVKCFDRLKGTISKDQWIKFTRPFMEIQEELEAEALQLDEEEKILSEAGSSNDFYRPNYHIDEDYDYLDLDDDVDALPDEYGYLDDEDDSNNLDDDGSEDPDDFLDDGDDDLPDDGDDGK